MNNRLQNRIFIGFISCFLIVGAVIFIFFLTRISRTVRQTSHYEVTQGKVVSSLVTIETEMVNGRSAPRKYYTPVIEYEVGRKIYQIKGELQGELRPATGIPVNIRYNPLNPGEAVFESKLFSADFFLLFFGFGLFIVCLFILSMEIEAEFFVCVRGTLLCLAFGTMGGGSYLYMGNSIGTFNPFSMIRATMWSIVPCLFLVFAGLVLFFSVRT